MADQQLGVAPTSYQGGIAPVAPPDFANADRTVKRDQDFNVLSEKIKSLGGLNTPEQRLSIVKDFKDVQPETNVLKALAAKMMGVPDAGLIATQGRITTKPEYDANGKRLTAQYAQNNPHEPLQVWDEDGTLLTRDQYIKRQGGQFATYAETPAGQARQIETETRKKAYESEGAATNVQAAGAPILLDLHKQQQRDLQALAKYNPTSDELTKLSSYSSATVGYTQSLSDAFNTLKQAQSDKSKKDELTKSGKLQAAVGIISGNSGLTKGEVESLSSSDLDQRMKNMGSSQELDTKFSQTKNEAFQSAWFKNLPPEAKVIYANMFNRAANIAQITAEASKYGDLAIAPTPYNPEVLQQAGSSEIQSVLGQFKAEAALKFAEWRKNQTFPEGKLPSPGELQSAFTRTDEYKKMKSDYGHLIDDVEARAKAQAIANEKRPASAEAKIGTLTPGSASGTAMAAKTEKRAVPPTEAKKPTGTPAPAKEDRVKSLVDNILKNLKK
ncbi:hypothetical protein [Caudoviricetes sp.]|nr:hypothetical protein [Caudoviricetes sp.]